MGKHISHIEFAYNRLVHYTTSHSPFEIVYGFNPLHFCSLRTPQDMMSSDANARAKSIKELHVKVKSEIERKLEKYARNANKIRK